MKDSRVYVAGKITGVPPIEVKTKFEKASNEIKDKGGYPLNPFDIYLGKKGKWKEYMSICVPMLLNSDAIYMLDNWRDSSGAVIEFQLALNSGLTLLGDVKDCDIEYYKINSLT